VDYVICLLMAWAFERAHMVITSHNYSSLYNGFGAIDTVNAGTAKAPMAYRVLMPWLIRLIERTGARRIAIYQGMKIVLNAGAFAAITAAFGLQTALLSAILLLLTIKFDYWDWQAEMIGVCAAMTGNLVAAAIGGMIHGLSKETAPLVPLAYLIRTGDWSGTLVVATVTALALALPRIVYGPRPMYCSRNQARYNLDLFKAFTDREFWAWGQWFHVDIFIACALTLGTVAAQLARPALDGIIPAAILAAGWTMAKADETRVFALTIPWIAFALVGG
jgi:hypothetical protein